MSVKQDELKNLILNKNFTNIPKIGDIVRGTIISLGKNEIKVDLPNFKPGVIYGVELGDYKSLYPDLKVGDEIEATVIDLENDRGFVELSLRFTGEQKVWEDLEKLKKEKQTITVKILDANHGGLMAVSAHQILGFIPVSQLAPDHYPRIPGGDKAKILEKLKEFVGQNLRVKVLDVDRKEKKLIFSEKMVWEEEQKSLLEKYKVGDIVEGEVTALADFGAFLAFDGLEGLVHISEIAWQRLDSPADVLKIGDKVKAKIINIDGSKIFLSIRDLVEDPWKEVDKQFKVGQKVMGKVLKINPFGLFVELTPEIHGLVHISELNLKPGQKIEEVIKPGDVLELKIISLEPKEHRLGLSQKALLAQEASQTKNLSEEKKEN